MLKQVFQQSLQQKLSPKQIVVVRLLQLPIVELEQRVEAELEENPALEEIESREDESGNITIDDYVNSESSYKSYNSYSSSSSSMTDFPTLSVKETLQEQLESQLAYTELNERQYALALFLIRSLETDGYLRRELSALVDDIAFRLNIDTDEQELDTLLKFIQEFDPAGIAARSLQECLLIQLKRKNSTPAVEAAIAILTSQFENFGRKAYEQVKEELGLNDKSFDEAKKVIVHLNPKPGADTDAVEDRSIQVVPDFFLEIKNGEFNLILPRYSVPELKISKRYENLLKQEEKLKDKDTLAFLRQKIEAAKWFIEALQQRRDTLMRTMQTILDYQRDYFLEGDENLLRPMGLKHVAAATGLDISTISRVVNSKYIQTHFGIFALKQFFTEAATNESSGETVSVRNVKKLLAEIIEKEEKEKPLSDEALQAEMSKQGFYLARRTVTKYREQLKIPTSRERRNEYKATSL